mgnify:CR=1 FL=1
MKDLNLTSDEELERAELRRRVLSACTGSLEAVCRIRQDLTEWLKRHPNDFQLLGEGESLVMLESALRESESLTKSEL